MTSLSTHRRWKGCPLCKPHKHRDTGWGPFGRHQAKVQRQMGGRVRRNGRHGPIEE